MATNNVTSVRDVEDGLRRGYDDAASLYRGNLDAMMASTKAMIDGMQVVSAEALAFFQSRMKETLEASRRLAACRDAGAAFETQIDFMRSSVQAYADVFKRMADVSGKVMNESFSPLAARGSEVERTASARMRSEKAAA